MKEIINHKHTFFIGTMEVEVIINYKDGFWSAEKTKGDTGTGACYGGQYESLEEYIRDLEKDHWYTYNFFNHGYKYAKANL